MIALRLLKWEVALEQSMPSNVQPEHRAAERHWILQWRAYHVFHDPHSAPRLQLFPSRRDQVLVFVREVRTAVPILREALARRRCPYQIVCAQVRFQSVPLRELEWVVWLRVFVDSMHGEACLVESHSGTSSTAEQVQRQKRTRR